jgi:hypothetical protein
LASPGIRSTAPLPFEPVPGGGLTDVTGPVGPALHLYDPKNGVVTHYPYLS